MQFDVPSMKPLTTVPYGNEYRAWRAALDRVDRLRTVEIPGIKIGVQSAAVTLEWTDVELPAVA